MRKWIIVAAAIACAACGTTENHYDMLDPVDYVNTLTGTESTYELSTGNTYPYSTKTRERAGSRIRQKSRNHITIKFISQTTTWLQK